MAAPPGRLGLDDLLPLFARGDHSIAAEFDSIARPVLAKLAYRAGWFLAPDQREEIVQQAMLLLLGAAGRQFDPNRGSARRFIRLVARRALRDVAAMYSSPGCPTRPPRRDESRDALATMSRHAVSLEAMAEGELPAMHLGEELIERQCEVAMILAAAPPRVAYALDKTHLQGLDVEMVCEGIGISRFALHREVKKFSAVYAA